MEFLANKLNVGIPEIMNILNKKSGVAGLSKIGSDYRDLGAAADKGDELAITTLDTYSYRVAKYIGAYAAAMNGVDAICFTAGIGENNTTVRNKVSEYLGYLGVVMDESKRDFRGEVGELTAPDSNVKVMLIPTNEELAIARETVALVYCFVNISLKILLTKDM
jgi:acetate kinase